MNAHIKELISHPRPRIPIVTPLPPGLPMIVLPVNIKCLISSKLQIQLALSLVSLSLSALKSITQSLVISRLDYCNALYAGAPDYIIKRLQHVQNMAARVITWERRSDDAELIRPVRGRVQFKVLLLTYKSLNDLAPDYIRDLLTVYNPR